MSQPVTIARRTVLQVIAGVPMLPLGKLASAVLLGDWGDDGADVAGTLAPPAAPLRFKSATFSSMAAPSLENAAAMATTTTSATLTVTLSDDTSKTFTLSYEPFFTTGDAVPDGKGGTVIAGGYHDIQNRPILDQSVGGKTRQFFSDAPDGSSLLCLSNASVPGVEGRPVFAVVQFEFTSRDLAGDDTYGRLPAPIAVLTLDQDPTTGALKLVKYHNVDTSPAHGLWITCGASLSPWNTHLSSEEYEPDAFTAAKGDAFKAFSVNLFGDEGKAKPYHYGHLPEITVHPDGTGTVKKHYCLGRISHELIQVMPDRRTALMGDDSTNGGLFLFVADREADLSAGTLYVAVVGAGFSLDPAAPGAPLTWIELGHATSAEIEKLADTLEPKEIMDVRFEDPEDPEFKEIFVEGQAQWVKLVPGMELAAAFLETHRYANLKGGSMAFTKMEGTAVNAKDKVAYSALSSAGKSMVKGDKRWRAALNVSLDEPLEAGAVLAHTLAGGQKDTDGDPIESDWVPTRTKALIIGEDIDADELGNTANPERIAGPDNLKFSETLRTLFIGEDSGGHVNNFLWAYDVDTKKLARILSLPAGAESTGLHAVDEINGFTYVLSNFQHAGDWGGVHSAVKRKLEPLIDANYKDRYGASVGYLTGDPTAIKLS